MSGVKAVKKKPPKGLKRPPPNIEEKESEDDFFASLGVKQEEKEDSNFGSEKNINYDESDVALINIDKSDSSKSQLSELDNVKKKKIKKKVTISKGSVVTDGTGLMFIEDKKPDQNILGEKISESSFSSLETKKTDIKPSKSSVRSEDTHKTKSLKNNESSTTANKSSAKPSKSTLSSIISKITSKIKPSKSNVSSKTSKTTNNKSSKSSINSAATDKSKTNVNKKGPVKKPVKNIEPKSKDETKKNENSAKNSKDKTAKAVKKELQSSTASKPQSKASSLNEAGNQSDAKSTTSKISSVNTQNTNETSRTAAKKSNISAASKNTNKLATKSGTALSSNTTLTAAEKEIYKIKEVQPDTKCEHSDLQVREVINYLNDCRGNFNKAVENYDESKPACSNTTLEKNESILSSVISYFMPSQKDEVQSTAKGTAVDKMSFNDLCSMTNRESLNKSRQNQEYELVHAIYCFIKGNGNVTSLEELVKRHREKQNLNSSTQIQFNESIFIQANNLINCLRNVLLNPFDNNPQRKSDQNFCKNTSEVDRHRAVETLRSKSSACLQATNLDNSASKVSYSSLKTSKSNEKKEGALVRLKKSISALFGRMFSRNTKGAQTSDHALKSNKNRVNKATSKSKRKSAAYDKSADNEEVVSEKQGIFTSLKKSASNLVNFLKSHQQSNTSTKIEFADEGILTTLKKSASNLFNFLKSHQQSNTSTKIEFADDEVDENQNDDQIRKFIQKNVFPEQIKREKDSILSDCKPSKKKYRIEDIRDMRKKEHKQNAVLISQLMKRMSQLSVKLCNSTHDPYYNLSLNYFDYASGYESPTSSSTGVNELN